MTEHLHPGGRTKVEINTPCDDLAVLGAVLARFALSGYSMTAIDGHRLLLQGNVMLRDDEVEIVTRLLDPTPTHL